MNNVSATKKFMPNEVKYDPALDVYNDVVLFPKKVELATEHFKQYALPHLKKQTKKSKKSTRTALQNELLIVYNFDPTEEQMLKLKAFLAQLFTDELKENQGVEIVV
jgi:hypothetical protein